MKGFVTNVTFVSLFSRMREPVILVVALLMKSFATKFANPRPVTLMDPHVGVESGTAVKSFSTSLTFVRLFIRVDNFVPAKR